MQYSAIMFDLDGTLLPMDIEGFMKYYFGGLSQAVAPLGMKSETLISAVWAGTKAMMKNDGQATNMEVFWKTFEALTGADAAAYRPVCDAFYSTGFHAARAATKDNPLAKEAVLAARKKAEKVILATNPLFPMEGQKTRLSWLGLTPEDFDLVTSYESDSYCKPNPQYYLSICQRMGVEPTRCLMIGNDDREDMHAARAAGLETWLVTDCRLPDKDNPWQGEQSTFAEMVEKLRFD